MKRTRGERLKLARSRHFRSARAAAAALGVPPATYGAHERAESSKGRDYGPDEAQRYGRYFRVSPEWLLTGQTLMPRYGQVLGEPEHIFSEGSQEDNDNNIAERLSLLALQAGTISLELEGALAIARRAVADTTGNKRESDRAAQTISRLIDSLDAAAGLIYSLASELDNALRHGPSPLAQIVTSLARKTRDRAKRTVQKKKK
jgi:hypothetical protein